MIRVGFYAGVKDALGVAFDISRDDLISLLEGGAAIAADPAHKAATCAFSTARYSDGVTRAKAHALDASAIALDVDEGWTLDAAEAAVTRMATPFVIYTTTKHRSDHHRFRIVLFLDRPADASEFEALWFALAKKWGVAMDQKTRDISRLSILPRAWSGTPCELRSCRDGQPVAVDAILRDYPRDPEPIPAPARPAFFDPLAKARADLRQRRNGSVDFDTLCDLDSSPVISATALTESLTGMKGGRTFKLLCSAAVTARRRGYEISVEHLIGISKAFSARVGRKVSAFEHRNDATNALAWAERRVL